MRMAWWCLGLLLSLPAIARTLPETPQFRHIGVADGLPSSSTTALALDRDGYLWIATRDGLARYDGVGYTVYRYAPGDPSALPGNAIRTVFVDSRDRVWVGVEGQGLAVLGADRRGFRRIRRANTPALHSDEVLAIAETADAAIWFGTAGGGLYRLDPEGSLARHVAVAGRTRALPSDTVQALAVDARGRLWVGTSAGLVQWTGTGFEAAQMPTPLAPVQALSPAPDGSLWIGTGAGLLLRHADGVVHSPAFAKATLLSDSINAILHDRQGTHWIGTPRGLVSERAGAVRRVDARSASCGIRDLVEDREGGVWLATDTGLLHLPAGWRQFAVFAGGKGGLARVPVRGIGAARDGGAWLVGAGGLVEKLDVLTGEVTRSLDLSARVPGVSLSAVLEQADGTLWLGHEAGLTRRDPAGRLQHWGRDGPDAVGAGAVLALLEDGDGLLWLAVEGEGVQARTRDGRRVLRFLPGDGNGADGGDPDQLALGPDGAVWLAGREGLRRWDAGAGRFRTIAGGPRDRVFGFAFVPPDTLWLHRLDQLEAYHWNGRGLSRFRALGADAGLPAVESGGLMADRSGVLWLTTVRGLWRYDPVGDRLRRFGVRDGLPDQEFLPRAPLMLPQGLGLASTPGSLLLFDPAKVRVGHQAPRLKLDAVTLRRDEDLVALDPDAGVLTMLPDDRELRVTARLLSFSDPGAHRYRFRLHGFDADWVLVGRQGERNFSTLEPGDYRLEIAASDAEGAWSAPLHYRLRVLAPWWKQAWARALAAAGLLVLLVVLARDYRRRLRGRHARQLRDQQRELSDQGSEAKSRFLAMLGHEIRTPMSGVLGMAELLQRSELTPRQRKQVEAIQRAGDHLLHLVNDALDLARIESGKLMLDDKAFDLHALLEEVSHLLQPLAAAKGLHFSLQRAPATPRALRGDAVRLRQILLNLGNNAVKFTDHGEVALRAAGTPLGLLLEISDTGPGMDEAQVARLFQRFEQGERLQGAKRRAGSGLGLAISQDLAQAMGGHIDVQSQPGRGTCLRVRLPLPVCELDELLPEQARRAPRSNRSLRVLVVEDDPTVATVVTGLLEFLGHEAVHASQGLAALTELAHGRFDLALLDLDLPGLDGFDLARIIRSQRHVIALVALTARSDPQAEALAFAAGMHGFLRKPVTSQILQEKIEQVLAAYRATVSGEQAALA